MKKFKFESVVSVIGGLLSITALYFSWQANRIAEETNTIMREQMASRSAVLRTSFLMYRFSDWNSQIDCEYLFSVGNLGLTPATIVDFTTRISFRDQDLLIEDGYITSGSISKSLTDHSFAPIQQYRAFLVPGDDENYIDVTQQIQEIDLLNLPLTLEAGEIINFRGHFTLYHNGTRDNFDNLTVNLASYEEYYRSMLDGFFPLEVTYSFYTASGDEIEGQRLPCVYMRG